MISYCQAEYLLCMDNRIDDVRSMTATNPDRKKPSADTSGRKGGKKVAKKIKKGKKAK